MRRFFRVMHSTPENRAFFSDVVSGLSATPKRLDPKYFYDQRGSHLFEQITGLDEYYVTRTERAILIEHGDEIVRAIGPRVCLVELGSGSSSKTRLLLDRLSDLVAYVPIDISCEHLEQTAAELSRAYPHVSVVPVCADYSHPDGLALPFFPGTRRVLFFPGSTIGNFHPEEASAFLSSTASLAGPGGGMVIGIDRKKDTTVLERAYNDRDGVTAAFNLNLLKRINRELGADFSEDRFAHRAFYNEERGRIEMHLVSLCRQRVRLSDRVFDFEEGESIFTEASYKYALEDFSRMAAGFWTLAAEWSDRKGYFSVLYLVRS